MWTFRDQMLPHGLQQKACGRASQYVWTNTKLLTSSFVKLLQSKRNAPIKSANRGWSSITQS